MNMTIYNTTDDIELTLGSNASLGISMLNINNIGSISITCLLFIRNGNNSENYITNNLNPTKSAGHYVDGHHCGFI